MKAQVGGERIEIVVAAAADLPVARRVLAELIGEGVEADEQTRRLTAPVSDGAAVLMEALRRLDAERIKLSDVALRRPTLDDVFLALTGHASDDSTGEPTK